MSDATYNVLVVANKTAMSTELAAAVEDRGARSPARFTLLLPVPAATLREEAETTLAEGLESLRASGQQVEGMVGFGEPLEVFQEAWDPRRFDEVIVSTLPGSTSKWLQIDLPHRIAALTGVQVVHVVSQLPRVALAGQAPPPRAKPALGPLSVLSWGGPREG